MKKTVIAALSAGLLVLGSCTSDPSDSTQNMAYPTMNLISSLQNDDVFVSQCTYKFFLNITKGKAVVSAENLTINNNNYSFSSQESPYTSTAYVGGGWDVKVKDVAGFVGNEALNNTNFMISNLLYGYNEVSVPGFSSAMNAIPAVLAQFSIGDEWRIRSFQADAFYVGKTVTSYPGENGMESFENDGMIYRIVIDTKENKANLAIYRAKFAPPAPELSAVVLNDLTVEWNKNGYVIKGEDVIPQVPEGTGLTPYPGFIFNNFEFQTTNDALTSADITYTVAGRFQGKFSGSYLVDTSGQN